MRGDAKVGARKVNAIPATAHQGAEARLQHLPAFPDVQAGAGLLRPLILTIHTRISQGMLSQDLEPTLVVFNVGDARGQSGKSHL